MKAKRHAKIIELIRQYEIETQEELAQRLIEAGFNVTQATISRDIRELKLSKVAGHNGRSKYAALTGSENTNANKYTRVLQDGFVSRSMATNLIVIKTVSGMAMAVAAALDAMDIPGMVGCIAGDDTIFCAIYSEAQAQEVMEIIDRVVAQKM
ncbi:transcriptional regulator of arginine metabolism [Catenibacillus scindens]|uniref:Arginine repressor n=1 Tax=Catenibacillus scindens TaxID=673271 RepID=A0A7W8M5F6_9FIRM|nr:arginine repressor [Catenibacillus scindens]MBB5264487.1 transcriptional regulator of arginine metabolism [Catenibacillus scindens]